MKSRTKTKAESRSWIYCALSLFVCGFIYYLGYWVGKGYIVVAPFAIISALVFAGMIQRESERAGK